MRDFIRFLDTYKLLLIFLALELFCFNLIYRQSVFQRNSMISSINSVTGAVFQWRDNMTSFLRLGETNDQLMEENLMLIAKSKLSYEKVDKDYALIDDTLYGRRYSFQYANVINSTKSELRNHLTLNKGRIHGIEPRMGVLSNMNLVGRVAQVTEHYSLVVPIIHTDFKVSAKIESTGHFGVLRWDGEDYRKATLSEIPKEAAVRLGDPIVTRGAGSLFPSGIPIGKVSLVKLEPGEDFFKLEITLDADMSKLNRVMLIKDLHRNEMDSLQLEISTP